MADPNTNKYKNIKGILVAKTNQNNNQKYII